MADQLSREMDPTPEALAKWIRRFRQLLGKAGIAALPVAGSLGDRIFVLEEEP
jgi:transposase-like protein